MISRYKTTLFVLFVISVLSLQLVDAALKPQQSLAHKIITLDPGHGGRDSGTLYGKLYEKDINLEISKVLKKTLEKRGATVYLLREDDRDFSSQWDARKKRGDLYRRILKIQENESDLYLSIHINWYEGSSKSGQEVLYHPINENNKILAESLQEQFKNDFGSDRVVRKTNLYLYANTRVPGVLIECGFLSNPNERYLLQQESHQQKLSNSITEGVIIYFDKLKEKIPTILKEEI